MAQLTIESGPRRGKSFRLPETGAFGIGRGDKCAIRLPDALLSRIHCVLRRDGDDWVLEDRGSLNGTLVNDVPVRRQALAPGDMVQVGDTLLSFAEVDDDPLVGRTVGGYRIESRLGRGAMGTVYLARQLSLDRPVALKILAPRFSSDAGFVTRFLEEARAAGRLNHPNVVQVYDAGCYEVDGDTLHFMSMEYLEGGSLQERLDREGQLSVEDAVEAALDAAEALSFAEQSHIVHRDIKPANLMLAVDGTVKVGDLGIAADLRRMAAGSEQVRVAGSPRYMAPEQAKGGIVDHRADVYALGATLYRAIAGEPPIDGGSVKEILERKLAVDPEPLRRRVPEVSPALSAVVQRMLARDPDERYAGAVDVIEALESALRSRGPVRRKASPAIAAARAAAPRAPKRAGPRTAKPRSVTSARVGQDLREGRQVRLAVGVAVGFVVLVVTVILIGQLGKSGDEPRGPRRDTGGSAARDGSRDAGRPGVDAQDTKALDRDESRIALEERDRIARELEAGRITAGEAAARLRQLATDHPQAKPLIEELLATVQKRAESEQSAAIAKSLEAVDEMIAGDDLAGALAVLAKLEGYEGPRETRAAIAKRRAAVLQKADETITSAGAEVDRLLAAGDVDGARARLERLREALPEALLQERAAALAAIRSRVDALATGFAAGERLTAKARQAWLAALLALDFDTAHAALDAAIAEAPEAAVAAVRDELAPTRARSTDAAAIWEAIVGSLDRLAAKRGTLRIAPPAMPWDPAGGGPNAAQRYRVLAVEGDVARLQSSASKGEALAVGVLDLPDEVLLELLDGTLDEPRRRGGLGTLLLVRAGPSRATPHLEAAATEAAAVAATERFVASVGDAWLAAGLTVARARSARLTGSGVVVPPELWQHAAVEVAQLIGAWRDRPGYAEAREELGELYRVARRGLLATQPPASLFHAKVVKIAEGFVTLEYDFAEESQLEDFVAVPEHASALAWVKKAKLLRLTGEARLLRGDPFREALSVAATVPRAGYSTASPNINVVLWTREEDRVTALSDGRPFDLRRWVRFDPGGGQGPAARDPEDDWFLFGMGYHYQVNLEEISRGAGFGGGLGRFAQQRLPEYFREPTFVILSGERAHSLHRAPSELLWSSGVQSQFKGAALKFQIDVDGPRIARWTVNGRPVGHEGAQQLHRFGKNVPHSGSMTLLSNQDEVFFSSLVVRGRLDEEWVTSRADSVVAAELARLDPAFAPKAETPKRPEDDSDGTRDARRA